MLKLWRKGGFNMIYPKNMIDFTVIFIVDYQIPKDSMMVPCGVRHGKQRNPRVIYIYNIYIYISMGIQDPKMEVLYHISPYFLGIFPYIALT